MRNTLVLALLVVVATVSFAPTIEAQAGKGPFVTDATNDVKASAGFTGQAAPGDNSQSGPVDLASLDLVEGEDAISFILGVRSLQSTVGGARHDIQFTFHRIEYRLNIFENGVGNAQYRANLYVIIEEDGFRYTDNVARLDVTTDTGANTLAVAVPKAFIMDKDGKTPVKGDLLKGIRVESAQEAVFSRFLLAFTDLMPDTGDAGSFNFTKGGFANGHLTLVSSDPFRVSNGGSNTYVMTAFLRNSAPIADDVKLVAENVPTGWDVTVPKRVLAAPNSDTPVTLLVSLPFAHEHGGVSEFTLSARSTERADTFTTIRMGILHTPIAQPTGHHDELYFHANATASDTATVKFGSGNRLGMNTEADHTEDVASVAPSYGRGSGVGWEAVLNPGLGLGIDMDLDRMGEATIVITPKAPGQGSVRLRLYHANDSDWTMVAEGESEPQAVSANAPATFVVPMKPNDDADYIAYSKGSNLHLIIEYSDTGFYIICCDEQIMPTFSIAESKLKLPLNEYRDVVTRVEALGPKLSLESKGPLEKKTRAGSTMTYAFNLTNNGRTTDTFVADVAGTNADLGSVVPGQQFVLEPGQSRPVTLAVRVPFDANPGQAFEVILLVRSQADPGVMALAHTYTTMTIDDTAQPDETQQLLEAAQAESKDTPGFALPAGLAVLALTALVLRRRRA